MRWSKLKSRVESQFAPAVVGHVELRDTWYRNTGQSMGRGWITIDGQDVQSFSDATWWMGFYLRRRDLAESWDEAEVALHSAGVLSRNDFYEALYRSLEVSVNNALEDPNPIVRGLAMLDRRLGKRRLSSIELPAAEHPFVQLMFSVRCDHEWFSNSQPNRGTTADLNPHSSGFGPVNSGR